MFPHLCISCSRYEALLHSFHWFLIRSLFLWHSGFFCLPLTPSPPRSLALWASSPFLHFSTRCQSGSCQSSCLPLSCTVQLSEPTRLAAFNASPWGSAISFLRWPQGLPGLGHFQVSCERFSPWHCPAGLVLL